jgi:hypothetical protein
MKNYTFIFLGAIFAIVSLPAIGAEDICNNLKSCAAWASDKTSAQYELGTLEKRTLKSNKDFLLTEGNPDFLFNFPLLENGFARVKRENGAYQIIQTKELKNFQFSLVKIEEIPSTLDFYSVEFSFSNKSVVKNAMQVFKKYISKEGRLLEVSNANKILATDIGIHLQLLRSIAKELNK